jgi:hypothetical protein
MHGPKQQQQQQQKTYGLNLATQPMPNHLKNFRRIQMAVTFKTSNNSWAGVLGNCDGLTVTKQDHSIKTARCDRRIVTGTAIGPRFEEPQCVQCTVCG